MGEKCNRGYPILVQALMVACVGNIWYRGSPIPVISGTQTLTGG